MWLWDWLFGRKVEESGPIEISMEHPEGIPVSETSEGKLWLVILSGKCPDCGIRSKFYEGPSGGLSTNIQCERGHWFNVTPTIGIAERIKR